MNDLIKKLNRLNIFIIKILYILLWKNQQRKKNNNF